MTVNWELKVSDIIKLSLIFFSVVAFLITVERWRQSVDDEFNDMQAVVHRTIQKNNQDKIELTDSLTHISNRLSNIEWKLKIHYEINP